MKKMIKFASAVAVAVALAQTTQAVPVTGNIGFTGGVTYNTTSAATATQVTSWISPIVTLDSGTFASYIPWFSPASFTASTWNFNTVTAIPNFWSVGGFTFQLLSSSIISQGGVAGTNGFVNVSGTGIVTGNGYDPTIMIWNFSTQDPAATHNPDAWTFSASAASAPDGGTTVMLLGMALSGVALVRRKLASR